MGLIVPLRVLDGETERIGVRRVDAQEDVTAMDVLTDRAQDVDPRARVAWSAREARESRDERAIHTPDGPSGMRAHFVGGSARGRWLPRALGALDAAELREGLSGSEQLASQVGRALAWGRSAEREEFSSEEDALRFQVRGSVGGAVEDLEHVARLEGGPDASSDRPVALRDDDACVKVEPPRDPLESLLDPDGSLVRGRLRSGPDGDVEEDVRAPGGFLLGEDARDHEAFRVDLKGPLDADEEVVRGREVQRAAPCEARIRLRNDLLQAVERELDVHERLHGVRGPGGARDGAAARLRDRQAGRGDYARDDGRRAVARDAADAVLVGNDGGVESEPIAALDHRVDEVYDLVVVEAVDRNGRDERGRFGLRVARIDDVADDALHGRFVQRHAEHLLVKVRRARWRLRGVDLDERSFGGAQLVEGVLAEVDRVGLGPWRIDGVEDRVKTRAPGFDLDAVERVESRACAEDGALRDEGDAFVVRVDASTEDSQLQVLVPRR